LVWSFYFHAHELKWWIWPWPNTWLEIKRIPIVCPRVDLLAFRRIYEFDCVPQLCHRTNHRRVHNGDADQGRRNLQKEVRAYLWVHLAGRQLLQQDLQENFLAFGFDAPLEEELRWGRKPDCRRDQERINRDPKNSHSANLETWEVVFGTEEKSRRYDAEAWSTGRVKQEKLRQGISSLTWHDP
jgi:hypothetical protein